ncbi:Major facilitator superfamily, partial [Globisporangium splendens]
MAPKTPSTDASATMNARESPGATETLVEPSPGLGVNPAILEKEAMLASQTTHYSKRTSEKSECRPKGSDGEAAQARRTSRLRSWYAHMVLICMAEFSAEAARGLVLPTLFTYAQELGGDIVFMGLLTSLFSVGRSVSSLLFGWLCDRISFRALYNVAGVISVIGNILYVIPYTPSVRSKALLGLSRCLVGFGAGNRSVCRANIAMLTNVDQRLEYFTVFATVVFLAYALTPGLGGVFGDIDVSIAGNYLELNRFTAPGFVLVGLNLMTIAFNNLIFDRTISREDAPGTLDSKSLQAPPDKNALKTEEGTAASSAITRVTSKMGLPERMVTIGALVFIFLNFNARGILSVFETVNIPLFLQTTNRTDVESEESLSATEDASSFYFVVGLLGLASYAAVQLLGKRISDVAFLIFGFAMLLIGNALLIVLCVLLSSSRNEASHFGLFVVSEIFVWSIGCPLTSAVVVSAFSKVLGTRPQGTLMGIFGSSAKITECYASARSTSTMELTESPLAGWNYSSLEKRCTIDRDIFGPTSDISPSFRGCCWNALTNCFLLCDPLHCCVRVYRVRADGESDLKFSLMTGMTIGEKGTGSGKFMQPVAVDVNLRGEIAVADTKLSRVQVSMGSGTLQYYFGRLGSSRGEFRNISDLKFTILGHLAIVDTGNHRIQIMTQTGGIVMTIGKHGWQNGEFSSPCAVEVAQNGDLFVCDQGNKRIQRLSAKGKFIAVWGSRRDRSRRSNVVLMGDEVDEYGFSIPAPPLESVLESPTDLVINSNGEVLVCDSGRQQILFFSDTGKCHHVLHLPPSSQPWQPVAIKICSNSFVIISRSVRAQSAGIHTNIDAQAKTEDSEGASVVSKVVYDFMLTAYPALQRVSVRKLKSWPVRSIVQTLRFLTYTDAIQIRLVNRFFHSVCRSLRNEWKLFPLTTGTGTIRKFNRVVTKATGLVAMTETFDKWALRIFKPSNRIRKHVMDFESGFCHAISSLYGAMFRFQHEDILRELFLCHSSPSEKTEIDQAAFVEIVTQIEEVRAGFLKWEECTAFHSKKHQVPRVRDVDTLPNAVKTTTQIPDSLRLVEHAQQNQMDKLLRKLQSL